MSSIKGWDIKFGFDGSAVEKGLKEIEEKGKKYSGSGTIGKENKLLAAQNILRRRINRAEKLGLNVSKEWSVLNNGAIDQLRRRSKELERDIIIRQRSVDKEKELQRLEKSRASGVAGFKPPSTKLNPLTFEGRASKNRFIDNGIHLGESLRASLSDRNDEAAVRLKDRLRREVERLVGAQKALEKVTFRNSTEYQKLTRTARNARDNLTLLRGEVKSSTKNFEMGSFAVKGFKNSLRNMATSYVSVFAAIAAITSTVRIGRDLEDTGAVMLLASGNAVDAARDMEYVGELSDKVAIRVADLTRSYAKYAVAGKTAGMENKLIKSTFEDLSIAVRATGLSQDRANLAFLGFQQMLAGPVVQAQEMNQIIEQLPQFAGTAAKALREMGFQAENYRDAIKTGTVNSQEFLTTVSRMMKKDAIDSGAFEKAMNSVTAASAESQNSLDQMIKGMFDSGLQETLVSLFRGISTAVKAVTPLMSGLAYVINIFAQTVAGTFSYMGKFLEYLGVSEGQGLVWVLRALGAIIMASTLPALYSFVGVVGVATIKTLGFVTGLWNAVAAANALKWAVRGLMMATGVGLVLAGGGFIAEQVAKGNSNRDSAIQQGQGKSWYSPTNNQVSVKQEFNIDGSMDAIELARMSSKTINDSFAG